MELRGVLLLGKEERQPPSVGRHSIHTVAKGFGMTTGIRRSSLLSSTASLLFLIGTASAARAADAVPADAEAAPAAAPATNENSEIIVTAQHRAERLDKVG